MVGTLNCVLCNHKILESDSRSNFTEGVFCADGAGCRRRALKRMNELKRVIKPLTSKATMKSGPGRIAIWMRPQDALKVRDVLK
jgi:hypothetical protein